MNTWPTARLDELCDISGGGTPSTEIEKYWKGNIPWVSPKDMKAEVVSDSIDHISQQAIENSATSLVPAGAALVVVRSGILARTVPVALAGRELAINQDIKALTPNHALINRYLYFFLKASEQQLLTEVSRGATVHRLSTESLGGLSVPLLPLAEQRRIVGILDKAFDAIAIAKSNTEKNLQNARAIFAAALDSAFQERSTGWESEPLAEFCEIKHGFAFDGSKFSTKASEDNLLLATPGNFTEDGRIVFNSKNSKRFQGKIPEGFRFEVGDLVVVMTDLSSKMKILGKPAFVEVKNVLHNQRIGRVIFRNEQVEKKLVYYFMMGEGFLRKVRDSATGTMVKHTAPGRILRSIIPFPSSKAEQQKIITRLDNVRQQTRSLEENYKKKLLALENLKASLLQRAFAGEL